MGPLTLPNGGSVYMDSNAFIYTVERIAPFYPLLASIWSDVRTKQIPVVTSELTILEVLTKPLQQGDTVAENAFRAVLLGSPDVQLYPISRTVLERGSPIARDKRLEDARCDSCRHGAGARLYTLRHQRSSVSAAYDRSRCHTG